MTEELQRQMAELTDVHKHLATVITDAAGTIVAGALPFDASADGLEVISESFEIELGVPNDFPESLPRVRETGGRIEADYKHRNPTGTLCLGVPVEQRRIFFEQPTLLGFVNRLVIPYLYGYCFFKKHGRHPFDEAEHGHEGILRHYIESLCLRDDLAALRVVCFLLEFGYRGHHDCPCGNGLKVRMCHGPALLKLRQTHNEQSLQNDFLAISNLCFAKYENGELSFPKTLQVQSLRLLKRLKSKSNEQV